MSLRDMIARYGQTYEVTRTRGGTTTNGRYVAGDPSTLSIVANVQPISGRELESMPEGERGTEIRQVFTKTELRTAVAATADDAGWEPDRLDLDGDGEAWEVIRVEKHEGFGETHYRALVS